MNEPDAVDAEDKKVSTRPNRKSGWGVFIGLTIYLLITGINSLLALIIGMSGNGWEGPLESQESLMFLILGANLPLSAAAFLLCGIGLHKPPMKIRSVLYLFGFAAACVGISIIGDVIFGINLYQKT